MNHPFDKGSSSAKGVPVIEYDMGSSNATGSPSNEMDTGSSVPFSSGISVLANYSGTTADGSAGLTVNFGVPLVAGQSVIACISTGGAGIIDDQLLLIGGGGESVLQTTGISGTGVDCSIWNVNNVAGGETALEFFTNTSVRTSCQVLVINGLANAAAFDTDSASGSAANSFLTGTVDTASHPNSLVVGMVAVNADTLPPDGGGDLITPAGNTGGASVWQAVSYIINSSGSPAGTWTKTGDSADFAGCIAGFDGA